MPAAPTADDLKANPIVLAALDLAWLDSMTRDPALRHEEGGWIYMDVSNGTITVRRAYTGGLNYIDLSVPAIVLMSVIVGKFHTHPNPTDDGWNPAPSHADMVLDWQDGVPNLIKSDRGIFVSGPPSRRGGLAGPPGFPF